MKWAKPPQSERERMVIELRPVTKLTLHLIAKVADTSVAGLLERLAELAPEREIAEEMMKRAMGEDELRRRLLEVQEQFALDKNHVEDE